MTNNEIAVIIKALLDDKEFNAKIKGMQNTLKGAKKENEGFLNSFTEKPEKELYVSMDVCMYVGR